MIGKLKYSFDVAVNVDIVVDVSLAQAQFARIGTQSPKRSGMFEHQGARSGVGSPGVPVPETNLQIVFRIIPQ